MKLVLENFGDFGLMDSEGLSSRMLFAEYNETASAIKTMRTSTMTKFQLNAVSHEGKMNMRPITN